MKLLLLSLFLITTTYQICASNCQLCISSTYCIQCSVGYRLSAGFCNLCNDYRCAQCPQSSSICTQCITGNQLVSGICNSCFNSGCAQCPVSQSTCTLCK